LGRKKFWANKAKHPVMKIFWSAKLALFASFALFALFALFGPKTILDQQSEISRDEIFLVSKTFPVRVFRLVCLIRFVLGQKTFLRLLYFFCSSYLVIKALLVLIIYSHVEY